MKDTSYTAPLLVDEDGRAQPLIRLSLSAQGDSGYDEAFLQDLMFDHPNCLPVKEIDSSYFPLIPICKELSTPAGFLDILYATPAGQLAIVEAKLWRNPEARRKVIGQILDYAKELSSWGYEDLQREVSKTLSSKGNVLYEIVKQAAPDTDEAAFCDAVSRSLARGKFLLLIAGDGIREGAGAIADFIERSGNLEFTFGLVELTVHEHPDARCLVVPRVVAKTAIIKRTVIRVENGLPVVIDDDDIVKEEDAPQELTAQQQFYTEFWTEFLAELTLDDQSQPSAKPTKTQNIWFGMPPSSSQAWVCAYFAPSANSVGVYLRFTRGNFADLAYAALQEQRDEIDAEIGEDKNVLWESDGGKHSVICRYQLQDPLDAEHREGIKLFFADRLNRFVNAFRPRLERISSELKE